MGNTYSAPQNTKRVTYYDVMRIIAIFLVVFNHLRGYSLYMISSGWKQWIYFFMTMITRINVPLFLMVSGALILGTNEKWGLIFKKRILRFVMILLIFGLGSTIQQALLAEQSVELNIRQFILNTFSGSIEGSYWYLYAYLGMLFMLPYMRNIAQNMSKTDFWMLIILHFVLSSLLPGINVINSITGNTGISINGSFSVALATTKAFFYPLIGYYIDKNLGKR